LYMLFVPSSFFFGHCPSDLRLLITPLVSSNFVFLIFHAKSISNISRPIWIWNLPTAFVVLTYFRLSDPIWFNLYADS
jgi:hypothetical protein